MRSIAHTNHPPIINTPPKGVIGPITARSDGKASKVASVTKAMMLPENNTVPDATAPSARRLAFVAVHPAAPNNPAPMTRRYSLAVDHASNRSGENTSRKACAPNAPAVAPVARNNAPHA